MALYRHEAFSFDSFQDKFLFWDDFEGDLLKDEWNMQGQAGGSGAVIDAQTGAIVRLTTDGDNGDKWHLNWGDIRSLHVDQRVCMEARILAANIANMNFNIYLLFDFNNFIRMGYSSAVSVNWTAAAVNGGATTTAVSTVAVDTNYHILRIEVHTHGGNHAHFYVDGTEIANSPITTNLPDDAADYLQPWFELETLENVAKTLDIDYCVVRQDR